MKGGGMNLGRCYNKYIIIDIFMYAAEKDARAEAESILWICSSRHRAFLCKDYDLYPRLIEWKATWASLKEQSNQLESLQQARFLFDNIRIDGEREVTKVTLIFTASKDGWRTKQFHRHCDNRGPTLCLIKSSE